MCAHRALLREIFNPIGRPRSGRRFGRSRLATGWLGVPRKSGAGQFVEKTPTGYGAVASGTPVDLDRDGDLDFVPIGTNTWSENTGDSVFVKRFLPAPSGDTSIARYVVDVDHDGYLDIVGSSSSQSKLVWLHNNGNRTFALHSTSFRLSSITAGDVDGDGFIDIVRARKRATTSRTGAVSGSRTMGLETSRSISFLPIRLATRSQWPT